MSSKIDYDPWDQIELEPMEIAQNYASKPDNEKDAWDVLDFKESFGKSMLRKVLQVPKGIAQGTGYGILTNLMNLISAGDALDEDEIDRIREISEREKVPFDEEQFRQNYQEALDAFPTISNIASAIEKKTGVPLEARDRLDKFIEFASSAGKIAPANMAIRGTNVGLPKAISGTAVAGANEVLTQAGVPEWLSNILSFGVLKSPSSGAAELTFGKEKPSGLPSRRFEKIKKQTKVSPSRFEKINEKIEGDFKKVADKILAENPTYQEIKIDPSAYAEKLDTGFEQLETLASDIPTKVSPSKLTFFMNKRRSDHNLGMKGLTPSEAESTFRKEFAKMTNSVSKSGKEFSIPQYVDQFRKNNKELSQYFEPGKSKAHNIGKRDALLEYNRAIEDLFENTMPDSDFTRLFKEQNQKWAQLKNFEFVEDKLGKIFEGDKVNFKDISKVLDKKNVNYRKPFESIMGKEGFDDFQALIKDFKSIESPYSLLKRAETAGFTDLAKIAGHFLIHPTLGKFKATWHLSKEAFQALLDKPQIGVTWKKAIDDLKVGKFAESEAGFNKLKAEIESSSAAKNQK